MKKSIEHLNKEESYRNFTSGLHEFFNLTFEDPLKILQQPIYSNSFELQKVLQSLQALDPFLSENEIKNFLSQYQLAAKEGCFLLTLGDCAERFSDANPSHVSMRCQMIQSIKEYIEANSPTRVFAMARMGGQFAKPRSEAWEHVGAGMIPCFRGENINGIAPDRRSREPDPGRMLFAAEAIRKVLSYKSKDIFTAHEALLLVQEIAFSKKVEKDVFLHKSLYFNHSSHFLWIGERTRQLDSAHIHYVSKLLNPIGIKIGPKSDPKEIKDILNFLFRVHPERSPISLITRFGSKHAAQLIPPLLQTLEAFEGKILWICDPMHGNIKRTAGGIKTRAFDDILSEVEQSFKVHRSLGGQLQGLHLETSPDDIRECIGGPDQLTEFDLTEGYQSYCDPRLNYRQAMALVKKVAELLSQSSSQPVMH